MTTMMNGKPELTWDDLTSNPVWYFDPDTDLYRPLISLDQGIGSIDELHFRTIFTTPCGKELQGSIAGTGDIAIGIFRNGRWYAGNKNFEQASIDQLSALLRDSPDLNISRVEDLLPLQFKTNINTEPFIDRSGVFDLTKLNPM